MKTTPILLTALLCAACGSESRPAAPTPIQTTPPPVVTVPTTYTLTGTVTAANGGQPVAATVTVDGVSAPTDGSGRFSIAAPLSGPAMRPVSLSGAGLVTRQTWVDASARELPVTAISLSGGFDLTFYRQLVRNGYESTLQPLRRWTSTPQFYLRTVDEAGEAMHGPTLDVIEATIKDAVPRWTSGRLGTPSVTRGTSTMAGAAGWVTVRFPAENATTFCGRAQSSSTTGIIELFHRAPPTGPIICRGPSTNVAPRTVRHEVGHVIGLSHTDTPSDLMYGAIWTDQNQLPSARELYHVGILYSRPVGNTDPDTDPRP